MKTIFSRSRLKTTRIIILPPLLVAVLGFVLSNYIDRRPAQAFSAGPPAGFTGAPHEFTCAECHVPDNAGTGHISITAPPTYVPGQTYPVTVTSSNADPTRLRWGFQLTVLDSADEKAGNLQSTDVLTQVLNNQGPGGTRQYIEHTSAGTFIGQQGGASWTFNWTAPATDIGPVTFYAAGNHANNDGNSSGDFIYFTFVASAPASSTPDFSISATPSSRAATPGNSVQYSVTITPLAGFTGTVNLSATGLPAGATASFNPTSVNITDPTAKTATLTITTTGAASIGAYPINATGASGSLVHSSQTTLRMISPTSIDLSLTKSASPNPGQVGVGLAYRLVVTNNGPATATNVSVTDALPAGVTFVSASASSPQASCNGNSAVNCLLGNLPVGATAVATINVVPTMPGQIVNSATATASEADFDTSNNSANITTVIQPAAVSPTMLDANLTVATVFSGLNEPTSMAFLGANDFLVLERTTGKVQRIVNGSLQSTVLDLPVNGASERGLLGIALHPKFAQTGFVYLYWTESSTGVDSNNLADVTVLGQRVDRYVWNGSTLSFNRNLIRLRAYQADPNQPLRGNHNGGVLRFGPDGKLYIIIGDNGRRGFLQNVTSGGTVPDDQFGGPEPDDAHLTGVILRLNDDGTTPADNPFFNATTTLTGEAAANIKKLYAYGVRNSFGMAFDPVKGNLWTQENGDDAFDEINRVPPGFNGGWVQIIGPVNRIAEYKSIESTYGAGNLQQLRWPPSNIADTPQAALSRLYVLPGSQYTDPEFSWKYAVAPSPIGFVKGRGLGPQFEGDLFVGASRTTLSNGYLFRFKLTADRQHFTFTDPHLSDSVADNSDKFDLTESESLLIGRDFGVTADIQTGPNGNLFVVSLSNGAVYEIKAKPSQLFVATLNGPQEVPSTTSTAQGTATLLLSPDETTARVSLNFNGLSSSQTQAHIHSPAGVGATAPVLFSLPSGQVSDFQITLTAGQAADLKNGLFYVNVHSTTFPNGEIRGQFGISLSADSIQLGATQVSVGEGEGSATVVVTRFGNTSAAATVDYATSDTAGANNCNVVNNNASSRCDYAATFGTLRFAAGEIARTITIPLTDDAYAEGREQFTISLSNPFGAFLGSPNTSAVIITDNESSAGANSIDAADYFVHQNYIDFLSREPDPSGLAFWIGNITSCGSDQQCVMVKRINVSAAFFLSIEFQQTGYLVERIYKASYGDATGTSTFNGAHQLPVPIVRLNEFLPDKLEIGQGVVVGQTGWETVLENNKQAFASGFVQRARFTTAFPTSMTPAQFVDKLFLNTGVTPSTVERGDAINEFGSATTISDAAARARVLRRVAENPTFANQEFNRAFVLMQFFGYLQRNPNDPQDIDYTGYDFWLTKLNQFNGNFQNAEMVKAFISSLEYRQRFGP